MPSGITTTTISLTTRVRKELGDVKDILESREQRTVTLSESVHILAEAFMRDTETEERR
jgi:hypothetical protein